MKANEISYERAKEVFQLETDTGRLFWRTDTSIRARGEAGYTNSRGYRVVMVDGKNHRAHRLVWLLVHGNLPKNDVDHINGVRSDNRPKNLREATRSENNQNRRSPSPGSNAPYLGVTWDAPTGKWRAQISANKRHKYLGIYATPEAAHAAYVQAKRVLHSHGTL